MPLFNIIASIALCTSAGLALAAEPAAATPSSAAQAGSEAPAPGLTREQVRDAYLAARRSGDIPETEADLDVAQTRRHFARRR
jgi:hypothetical protein